MTKQDSKPDRRFENASIPSHVKSKRPMKIPCLATIVDQNGEVVDGWEVNFFRRAEKLATQNSVEGKVGGDIDVLEPGTYRIEMEMLDTHGKRVVFYRDVVVEEEKEEKKTKKIFLRTNPIQHEAGYDIVVLLHDENNDPVLTDISVTLRDPRTARVKKKKTDQGIARFTDIPVPESHIYVEVSGAGRSNSISLYPFYRPASTIKIGGPAVIEAEIID